MNKKSIFESIKNCLSQNAGFDDVLIIGDQATINYKIEDTEFAIIVRCQNFGDTYLFNTNAITIRRQDLESRFESLLLDELKRYYNNDFTLSIGAGSLGLNSVVVDFKLESDKDIQNLNKSLEFFIKELRDSIFHRMTNVREIASYISSYKYTDNLKVLVGGRFPVQNLKKVFLLFEGGQMDKYEEYKEGLLEQIESFPSRKPNRKEEAKFFEENYNYLINKLEARGRTKPIA